MAISKSPFLVYKEFLSPMQCEKIIDRHGFRTPPDIDPKGRPLKRSKHVDSIEDMVFDRYKKGVDEIATYYDFQYRGTGQVMLEQYDQGVESEHQCDNSSYINKKWTRTRDRDFSCVIFLNDYQDTVPFDGDYDVCGGKLEFPQHQFSFQPQRGTMIIFPSGPHFINVVAPIEVGELYLIRFSIAAMMPYLYQPAEFPGDFSSWFANEVS